MSGLPSIGPGERAVLLGPDALARLAARRVQAREQRWFLLQPRHVRRSFVGEVVDAEGGRGAQERWMLLQADEVRISYVEHVLEDGGRGDRREVWMLRQSKRVRESYVREVIDGRNGAADGCRLTTPVAVGDGGLLARTRSAHRCKAGPSSG